MCWSLPPHRILWKTGARTLRVSLRDHGCGPRIFGPLLLFVLQCED